MALLSPFANAFAYATTGYLKPFLFIAGLLFLSLRYIQKDRDARSIRGLGGYAPRIPSRLPFGVDNISRALRAQREGRIHEHWLDLLAKYDPMGGDTVEQRVMGRRMIFTSNPENIKAMMATKFSDFGRGPIFRKTWSDFLGLSIFTADGRDWHHFRQLLRPQFIQERVSDLDRFERHARLLIDSFGVDEKPIDLQWYFARFTLDVATGFLFGRSAGSLSNGQNEFATAFDEVSRVQAIIFRSGPLAPLIPRRQFRKNIGILEGFLEPFIDDALRISPDLLERVDKSDEGFNFLHSLAKDTRDRKVIRDQLMSLLLAGRDTTTSTLTWLFYELAQNPHIFDKLRTQVLASLGSDRAPTYKDLKELKYLRHTISETLRLYPPLSFNVRYALRESSLPEGGDPATTTPNSEGQRPIGVLPNTMIMFSPLLLQRNPKHYPEPSPTFAPPEEFSPERWENWTPQPWSYVPFNGGPRMCLGQDFASTQIAYTTVRILQRFSKLEMEEASKLRLRKHKMVSIIHLYPAAPVMCRFTEAKTGAEKDVARE